LLTNFHTKRQSTMSDQKVVAVLGCGAEAKVLADGFLKHGFSVVRGARDPSKIAGWLDSIEIRYAPFLAVNARISSGKIRLPHIN